MKTQTPIVPWQQMRKIVGGYWTRNHCINAALRVAASELTGKHMIETWDCMRLGSNLPWRGPGDTFYALPEHKRRGGFQGNLFRINRIGRRSVEVELIK